MNLSDSITLARRVNALYGQNATSQYSWDLTPAPASAPTSPLGGYTVHERHHRQHQRSAQRSDLHYHYFANICVTKGGPEAAYRIYVFLDATLATGEVSTATWLQLSGPDLVGFTGFQSMGEAIQDESEKITGVVALTEALEEKVRNGQLASMDEATVAAYLQEKMTWQIVVVSIMPYP
jgi:tyrosinase